MIHGSRGSRTTFPVHTRSLHSLALRERETEHTLNDLLESTCMPCCSLQLSGHKDSIFEGHCGQTCQVWDFNLESKRVRTARKLRCRISFPSAAVRKCAGGEKADLCLQLQVVSGKAWRQEHEMDLSRRVSSLKAQRKQ